MFHNREYSVDYFRAYVYSKEYVVVTAGSSGGVRSQKLLEEFPAVRHIDISYSVKKNTNGTLEDSFVVSTNFQHDINGKHFGSLYQDLATFVNELNRISKCVIIDISELHLRFLGAFLAMMDGLKWDNIVAAYAEPTAYIRSQEVSPDKILDPTAPRIKGSFDLNTSFWGYDEIPNLKTTTRQRDKYIWIAFLGFEGKRAAAVYQEISDDSSITIPVITMPAIRPGWASLAFEANQILFDNARITCQGIEYVDALDPYASYNLIEKIHERYSQRHIVISPLGTRPVSLGVLLYAMKHEESEVYFDTPKESRSVIDDVGKVHFYDLLSFFIINKE